MGRVQRTESYEQLDKPTKTDTDFQKDAVERKLGQHWLNFSDKRDEKCWQCKKPFSTYLEKLRYCSVECRGKAGI